MFKYTGFRRENNKQQAFSKSSPGGMLVILKIPLSSEKEPLIKILSKVLINNTLVNPIGSQSVLMIFP
ncbi:MAG: hypothetical protein KAJ23_16270 [Maribacter sp.]|nr:hypothetical protein [Maribacter sp.]